MKRTLALLAATLALLLPITPVASAAGGGVIVNRVPLSNEQVGALEYLYGPIRPGSYWYDSTSGLWGSEGGPSTGQILSGMNLGGPLRSDASAGTTGVFFNGRQLHASEVGWLQQRFGVVYPGRYWLGSNGVGGPEGGPAMFSLAGGNAGGGSTGGGGGYYDGYIDRGYGGTYGTDGTCFYISVEGGDVMGPGC
jgi:hypothetical protein